MTAPFRTFALALAIAVAGCSGGSGDATGPDPVPPGDPQNPAPLPLPAPEPEPEPEPQPQPGVRTYVLAQINNSTPGQLVTISNPDGLVIGLYWFEPTTLTLDALQRFELVLRYTDDKTPFGIDDAGEFKQAGPVTGGALPVVFSSAVYDDKFTGLLLDDVVAINYDFDGDGRLDTSFTFQRAD